MFKTNLILFLIILLTACSNLKVKNLNFQEKISLENQIEDLKTSLKSNDFIEIESFLESSLKKQLILTEIKKIDFTNTSLFSSPLEFENSFANNTLGVSFQGYTLYLDLKYQLKKNVWKIVEIKERRR
ncbi:MAG: hypothetical protein ACRC0K_01520 [Fusobacteriaceae bacterium]